LSPNSPVSVSFVSYSYICLQVDIAAGGWHSAALTKDGEVFPFFDLSWPIMASSYN
jgi:alpha-tubulin suppressor-like RCC1 family protein